MTKNGEPLSSHENPQPNRPLSALRARLAKFARWALCPYRRVLVKIVPHHGDAVYKLEVSHRHVTFAAIALLLLLGTLLTVHIGDVRAAEARSRKLQAVEAHQRQELAAFSTQTKILWQKIDRLQRDDQEIRRLTKVIVPKLPPPKNERKTVAGTHQQYSYSKPLPPSMWRRIAMWFRSIPVGSALGFEAEAAELSSLSKAVDRTDEQTSALESGIREAAQRKIAADLARARYLAAIPSIWPTLGYVSSGFGYRSYPDDEFHPGLDIVNDYGAPIYATAAGVVAAAGWYGGYGLRVVIDHGNGLQTMYAHAAQILVNEGDVVKKGQQIATVGSTGYATGPHVHYEIELWGKPIDPTPYLNGSVKVVASS